MNMWNWLLTLIGRRFPLPSRHILTYEEIRQYWESLNPRWQRECSVIVLRIRKPVAGDDQPNIWRPPTLPTRHQIYDRLSLDERRIACEAGKADPYTIRIDREWEVQPGIKRKEEVCVANFEL